MRIVVFGAGGFVGGWICEQLAAQNDIEVVPCVRRWSSAVRIARRGIEARLADIADDDAIAAVLTGADVVVNAAMPSPAIDARAAISLYRACRLAGVRRYVHLSSAAVYGGRTGDVSEVCDPSPVGAYAQGKAAAEAALLEASTEGGPLALIFRPSIIYGPFSDAWTVRYARMITAGRWASLGHLGRGTCNLIHVQDLVSAVFAGVRATQTAPLLVLNINNPHPVTWNEYIENFGKALAVVDRTSPSAVALVGKTLVAEGLRKGNELLKQYAAGALTRMRNSSGMAHGTFTAAQSLAGVALSWGELGLLRRKVNYRADRATSEIGFTPAIPLDDGLEQSAAWCHVHGVV